MFYFILFNIDKSIVASRVKDIGPKFLFVLLLLCDSYIAAAHGDELTLNAYAGHWKK